MFILTFVSIALILSRGKARRSVDQFNVDNSNWDPFLFVSTDQDESPNYDITHWVRQLHLQQCAFVEIGEGFCALFVELRSIPSESKVLDNSGVGEFFLGVCPCLTLHTWDLCSTLLTSQRTGDCTFKEATPYSNTSARVHRRLCDVTLLIENAVNCNCSITLAGQTLYKTKGFPTCFLNPLPESLCSPRSVCGIARCSATTIKGIHTPQCAPNCHQRQPFCEEIGPWTSIPAEINSLWSRWSSPKCNNTCGNGFMVAVASCQDQVTGKPAIDCIGPGSFCCPDTMGKCYCEVSIIDGIMRAARFTEACVSTDECAISDGRTFTSEEIEPGNSIDIDESYKNDDNEQFEDTPYYSKSVPVAKRHLLQIYSLDSAEDYEAGDSKPSNEDFKNHDGYQSVFKSQSNSNTNYDDQLQNDDDEEDDGKDEDSLDYDDKNDDEGDDDDEEDETVNNDSDEAAHYDYGSAKGHRSPKKRVQEAKSDYASVTFKEKLEDDEPEKKEPAETRSVTESCDDDSPETLQYYDYDDGESVLFNIRVELALKLVTLNTLLWFYWY